MTGTARSRSMVAGALLALMLAGATVAAATRGGDDASTAAGGGGALDLDGGSTAAAGDTAAKAAAGGQAHEAAAGGGAAEAVADDAAASAAPAQPVGSPVSAAGPRIVRTGELRLQVAEGRFATVFDRVAAVAAVHGGFVSSSTSSSDGGGAASGELVLRVPSERFDAARRALRGLGKVRGEALGGDDVTGRLVDLEARIRTLRAEEEALRTLMGKAVSVGEVLQVQPQLFDVREQIEQLESQRASLDDAATFATLRVGVTEAGAPARRPGGGDEGLAASLRRAVDAAEAVVGGMIVVVAVLLPFAPLVLGAWLGARALGRRRPATEVRPVA